MILKFKFITPVTLACNQVTYHYFLQPTVLKRSTAAAFPIQLKVALRTLITLIPERHMILKTKRRMSLEASAENNCVSLKNPKTSAVIIIVSVCRTLIDSNKTALYYLFDFLLIFHFFSFEKYVSSVSLKKLALAESN